MPYQTYHAEVAACRDLTHDVREMTLRLLDPPRMSFLAGQFISFEIPVPGDARRRTRAYSIASPPREAETVQLVLNLVPGGPGSEYLFDRRPGEHVQFKGPAGSFYLRPEAAPYLLFVATGTGIAPLRSMILDLLDRPDAPRAALYWGLRSQRDLYYQKEFQELTRRHPAFEFVPTLSQPQPGWNGQAGRVTRLVAERVQDATNLAAYLCGNRAMIRDVSALLNAKGLPRIFCEQYYDDTRPAQTAGAP